MGCCAGDQLGPVVEELTATRAAPEGAQKKGLSLEPGPAFIENPITKKKDLPLIRHLRQIMIDGMRIGYVTLTPGGAINLHRTWEPAQLEAIQAAVMEELALGGFDVLTPRRVSAPRSDGLVSEEADEDEGEETSRIILPD